jgi:hypothetical protein
MIVLLTSLNDTLSGTLEVSGHVEVEGSVSVEPGIIPLDVVVIG